MRGTRAIGLFAFILACSHETLAGSTPFYLQRASSHNDMRHPSQAANGSNVNRPRNRIPMAASQHDSFPQVDARQIQPEFGSLSNAFRSAIWMWTPDATTAPFNAPDGDRFFRFTYNPPTGKTPSLAEVMITADNKYTLLVNGAAVGSSPSELDSFRNAQGYRMALPPGPIVFAISATNVPQLGPIVNPAGLLVAIRITHTDGTEDIISSGPRWLASIMPVPGFEQLSADLSLFTPAKGLVRFGLGPWSTAVTFPTTLTTVAIPIPPSTSSSISSSSLPSTSSSSSTPPSSTSSTPLTSSLPPSSSSLPTFVTVTETSVSDQATNVPAASPSTSSSSKTNNVALIGSILGGIVGGLLILLLTFIFLRRRKRKADMAAAAFDTWTPAPHALSSPETHIKPFMVESTNTTPARSESPAAWQHRPQPQQQQWQYGSSIDAQYGNQQQQQSGPGQAPYRYPPPSASLASMADSYNPPSRGYEPNGNWGSNAQLMPPVPRKGTAGGNVPQSLTPGNMMSQGQTQGGQGYYPTSVPPLQSYPNPHEYQYR